MTRARKDGCARGYYVRSMFTVCLETFLRSTFYSLSSFNLCSVSYAQRLTTLAGTKFKRSSLLSSQSVCVNTLDGRFFVLDHLSWATELGQNHGSGEDYTLTPIPAIYLREFHWLCPFGWEDHVRISHPLILVRVTAEVTAASDFPSACRPQLRQGVFRGSRPPYTAE